MANIPDNRYIIHMENLYSKFKLKDMTLRNRIVMPPMCMYSSDDSGEVMDWHLNHYETRSVGGAGLIIIEATAVEKRGRISGNDLGIWDESHVEGLSELVKRIKKHGAAAGIQLAHAGRKCTVKSEDVIAPSSLNFDSSDSSYINPREMDNSDIADIIESFRKAAERAFRAGFDIIEIHGAHGYLINEFLSPLTNKRTDSYGGEVENRSRILREIAGAVKGIWPEEKPVSLRITADDYYDGGNKPEDLSKMINHVKNTGIDIIHVSSGGVTPSAVINPYPGYQIPAAETVRKMTALPVVGGGLITSALMADEIIRNRRSDLVFMGRELLRNPYFPLLSFKELRCDIDYKPYQYERAF